MLVLLGLLLTFIIFICYVFTKSDINIKALRSLPLIIFITDKNFNITYKNKEASFIDKIYIKDYQEKHCQVYLDETYTKCLTCYSLINGDEIYFISLEQNQESTVSFNSFKLKLLLEYVGKLLNSDWVSYYTKQDNKFIIAEEYWKNSDIKTYYGDEISIESLEHDKIDFSRPYCYLNINDLVTENRIEQWKKVGVHTKIIVPICNEDGELEKLVSFSYYPNKYPVNDSTIQLVVGVINYIVGIKLKFEIEHQHQEQVQHIQDSLALYINNEKNHRKEMAEKTNKLLKSLDDLYKEEDRLKKINCLYEKDYTK